ncbi:HU family DNA-binding protein [Marispirochaeta aestuarii]|uniref:HU family DNA-binding protein n=1 Tax=Marispirochaeta aestuarii TaxID=1963862 RepID=UPI002ABD9436|nr:HU family DNA-binding protein [Marispirochaeta aestuarii]
MVFESLPPEIQRHLEALVRLLPDQKENSLELLARVWEEKDSLFQEQAEALGMFLERKVVPGEGNGMLALTSSGSILSIGPGTKERLLEYASIKTRTDVPDIFTETISVYPESIAVGESVSFPEGRLNKTSPIYRIAVCSSDTPREEQEKRIREATIYLTNGFMKLNRSLHLDPSSVPDQFTMKSMVRYVAKKNGVTASECKSIVDDFLYLIETGLCLGEKVPLGRIGRFSIKQQDARKARIVKHPGTGREVTVEAKPAVVVPRISFSSYLKERLSELPLPNSTIER